MPASMRLGQSRPGDLLPDHHEQRGGEHDVRAEREVVGRGRERDVAALLELDRVERIGSDGAEPAAARRGTTAAFDRGWLIDDADAASRRRRRRGRAGTSGRSTRCRAAATRTRAHTRRPRRRTRDLGARCSPRCLSARRDELVKTSRSAASGRGGSGQATKTGRPVSRCPSLYASQPAQKPVVAASSASAATSDAESGCRSSSNPDERTPRNAVAEECRADHVREPRRPANPRAGPRRRYGCDELEVRQARKAVAPTEREPDDQLESRAARAATASRRDGRERQRAPTTTWLKRGARESMTSRSRYGSASRSRLPLHFGKYYSARWREPKRRARRASRSSR